MSCQSILPDGTTLLMPGDTALTDAVSPTWCEFWIDRWGAGPGRQKAPTQPVDFLLTVSAFGRPPTSTDTVQQSAERLRQHLTQLNLPVTTGNESSGLLRLLEAELRDLSRPATAKSAGLIQWVITVRGVLHSERPAMS